MDHLPLITEWAGNTFQISLAQSATMEQLEGLLAAKINQLIIQDFSFLVQVLYRVDISEAKLKHVLAEHPQADAGLIIARLLIERQLQKITTRETYRQQQADDSEERW
jgi:hypothetical protein